METFSPGYKINFYIVCPIDQYRFKVPTYFRLKDFQILKQVVANIMNVKQTHKKVKGYNLKTVFFKIIRF